MTPLRLIVGIGNPGSEYRVTRHNAGAWFVERLGEAVGAPLGMQAKFHAIVGSVRADDGVDRRLALPQTFVNRSGQAVSALARFYRIAPEEILVAHDELDLKPGAIKLKQGGGSAGHNGLKDIVASLGTPDFWRLRIGIGHPREGELSEQEVADYVLHKPRLEEQQASNTIARALAIWRFSSRQATPSTPVARAAHRAESAQGHRRDVHTARSKHRMQSERLQHRQFRKTAGMTPKGIKEDQEPRDAAS
jgi:PTH1 family peptidyl-tRNA hydrolase